MAIDDNINMSGDDATKKHDDIGFSSELNLSFGDTLYLHPNDTSGSSIVTISSDLFTGAIYAKTTFEMWSDLKETYEKVDGSPVFNLHKNESYLAIRSNILTRETLLLVKVAFAIISGEESHRNVTSVGATKPATTAFAAKTFDNKRRTNNNSNFNKDVLSLLVILLVSNNATTNISPVSLSNEQLSRLMNLLNDNGVSFANANMAGADQHMTVSAKFFVNVVDISNLGLTVEHPNDTQALITKIRKNKQ
ncbi:hypothetical protein Tco_1029582 [Tanacetum coccineum]|uniref:rRNA N-glycosidase n=1 Tax=Tanacetum coccineum TaxID=301880 RepID=A0ABQ5G422_9ASTR